MSSAAMRVGRVIRANRQRRGLSQEALAELASLSRSFLGEIERGSVVPSIETLQKLADALGEKLSYFIIEAEREDAQRSN